jgi:polysaccharide deacetylase 2 family uncharacterized protein YibQ
MASKPKRSKRARRRGWSSYILSFLLGASLVILGYSHFSRLTGERPHRSGTPSRKASPPGQSAHGRFHDVEISKKDASPPSVKKEEGEPSPSRTGGRPKIAIVIDDLGEDDHVSRELLHFDFPLTFSILPFATHSKPLAIEAPRKRKEVILHLPMEPHGYPKVNPGEGALLEEMSNERLLRQLSRDIESVPNIKGVSNHMGSRLMEDSEKLKIIFSELKRRGLFFLDSRTTPQTLGLQTARLIGVKATERTLFIDPSPGDEKMKERLDQLMHFSLSTGIAIGIGHPYPATIKSLRELVQKIKEKGIEIVPLSELIDE